MSSRMPPAIRSTSSTVGSPPRPAARSPIHSVSPEDENCADRASPPPKSSSTPHGSFTAESQSSRRTPRAAPAGHRNSSRPAATAIPASEISGSSKSTGTKIQASAASTKSTSTRFSPEDMGPSLCSSSWISSLPPGISLISGLNSTLVSRNQHTASSTTARGTPTSIHWPKPIVMPCASER